MIEVSIATFAIVSAVLGFLSGALIVSGLWMIADAYDNSRI